MLSRRAARKHLVASRLPKYFLRPRSAGSVSPGSGRPVRRELGYGPAVRLKPFRPHLTVGALSCALGSQRAQHAPTARTRQAAGAHPGGFPAGAHLPLPWSLTCIPSSFSDLPAPGEALPPPFGYGPRLGSVRLDFHQLATRPARRALRPAPTAARPPWPLPGFAGYRRASLPATHSGGAETALPSSQDDHPHVQRPIRRRVPRRPLLDPRRLPWPSPSPDRLGSLSSRPQGGRLTTLARASLTLQTARSLTPRFAPGLSTTHGGITTGDPDVSPDRTHTGRPP